MLDKQPGNAYIMAQSSFIVQLLLYNYSSTTGTHFHIWTYCILNLQSQKLREYLYHKILLHSDIYLQSAQKYNSSLDSTYSVSYKFLPSSLMSLQHILESLRYWGDISIVFNGKHISTFIPEAIKILTCRMCWGEKQLL